MHHAMIEMPQVPIDRRRMLTLLACGLAQPWAVLPVRAAEGRLTFEELYASFGVLGLSFSDKVKALAGKTIAMRGFMAPPLKAEADFFVLTKMPMALCPFCSSDADWPNDIMVVYLDRAQTFEQANGTIDVEGRLEVGSWTDPETGFVSLLRITGASFRRA